MPATLEQTRFPDYLGNLGTVNSKNSFLYATGKSEDIFNKAFKEVGLPAKMTEAVKAFLGFENKTSSKVLAQQLIKVIDAIQTHQLEVDQQRLNTLIKIAKRAQAYGNDDPLKDSVALTHKFAYLQFEIDRCLAKSVAHDIWEDSSSIKEEGDDIPALAFISAILETEELSEKEVSPAIQKPQRQQSEGAALPLSSSTAWKVAKCVLLTGAMVGAGLFVANQWNSKVADFEEVKPDNSTYTNPECEGTDPFRDMCPIDSNPGNSTITNPEPIGTNPENPTFTPPKLIDMCPNEPFEKEIEKEKEPVCSIYENPEYQMLSDRIGLLEEPLTGRRAWNILNYNAAKGLNWVAESTFNATSVATEAMAVGMGNMVNTTAETVSWIAEGTFNATSVAMEAISKSSMVNTTAETVNALANAVIAHVKAAHNEGFTAKMERWGRAWGRALGLIPHKNLQEGTIVIE